MFGMTEGFDIVIGNPPYGGTYSLTEKNYFKANFESAKTIPNKQKGSLDTFTLFIEQGFNCLHKNGCLNYIVPIAITSSDSMTGIHNVLESNCDILKISSYSVRPQPVFQNAVVNTSILFFTKTETPCTKILATKMYRKNKDFNLQYLVNNLQFIDVFNHRLIGRYPKISLDIERKILDKIYSQRKSIGELISDKGKPIYYRTTGGRYYKVITPYSTGSTKETSIIFDKKISKSIGAILSSNLYFWFYQIYSNNLDLKFYEVASFKIPFASTIKNRTSRHTTKVFNRACKANVTEKLSLKNFPPFKKK
jgi:type I restriction-modification system DNA methylase subunit